MTDNSRASLGTQDGDTFAFDDILGIKFARSKLVIGADGTNDGDVSAANPLPVSLASLPALAAGAAVIGHVIVDSGAIAATQSGAYNITNISGTITLPTGAATDTLQTSGNASLTAINNKLPSLGAAATTASVPVNIASDQTVPISNANLTTIAALSGTQGAAASSQTGVLGLGYASDNPSPATDGYLAALSLDTDRRLRVSMAPGAVNWFSDTSFNEEFRYTTSGVTYV